VTCRIIIPSARAANVVRCVRSIVRQDEGVPAASIIVVDDGARADAESEIPGVEWITGAKPFVFASNVNLGIVAAGDADVILLNDDATLRTERGFTGWAAAMQMHRHTVASAAIVGTVCNVRQYAQETLTFRPEPVHLAFVAVYIPRPVINKVGLLDERFTGYGYEDFDFCRRVRHAGMFLATWDGCVVDHSGHSTFRNNPDWPRMMMDAARIFRDKWPE
jgi:GT2 family glycosyltransferase